MSSLTLEAVFFGHVVIDTVVKGGTRWQSLGGTAVYGALTALRHECKPAIVSKVGEDFPDEYLIFLSRSGIDISYIRMVRGTKTTRFRLVYRDSERELTLQAKAENLGLLDAELVDLSGKVAVIGPVIGEVPLEVLESVRPRAALTAVDLQGYLRMAKPREPVRLVRSELALGALSKADIVHVDAEEARVLTGLEPPQAAEWLAAQGPKAALVTMGHTGAYVAAEGRVLYVPALVPEHVVDATGAGDIFLTVFTLEWARNLSIEEAAAMAAAAASLRVERQGFDGLRDRWTVRSRAQKLLEQVKEVRVEEARSV